MSFLKHNIILLFLGFMLFAFSGKAQTKNSTLVIDIFFDEYEHIADLKAIDLNNDGADELIVITDAVEGHIYSYRWYGTQFQQIWSTNMGFANWVYGAQLVDFDNDEKSDILVSCGFTGSPSIFLYYYKNAGDIFIGQGPLILHSPDQIFCAHDLDNDSLVDLATGSVYANSGISIQLYKHDSINHTVQDEGLLPDATNGANMVKPLNLNNDEKMDILGAEKYSGNLYTYLNEGEFNFIQTYSYQFQKINDIETADFNNDGFEDFIIAEKLPNSEINVFKNLGNNEFEIALKTNKTDSWIVETVTADLNNDNNIDFITAAYDGSIYLFKNLGNFVFEELIYPNPDTITSNISTGDFDGNGEVDLVFGKNPAHVLFDAMDYFIPVSVYENTLQNDEDLLIYQNTPNPVKDYTKIRFNLNQNKTAILEIFDYTGNRVLHYHIDNSIDEVKIQNDKLKSGIYFYHLKTNKGVSEIKKMIKL